MAEFKKKEKLSTGEKLKFSGVEGKDVYNISAPFTVGEENFITGRVENRENCKGCQVKFFQENDGVWSPTLGTPILNLEDGFTKHINNEIVIGGVETYHDPIEDDAENIGYHTMFYKGKDLTSLTKFTKGPDRMKDIRLIQKSDGTICVFSRPQGEENGRGKIAYCEIKDINDLTPENILKSQVIDCQFDSEEWGGTNELHLLENGKIGVLGHIAHLDDNDQKHYYAMSFIYDPKTHTASPIKIIAIRKEFPDGPAKHPELDDVIFPGGLIRNKDGTATLYVGLSDTEAGILVITDPFIEE